MVIVGSPTIGIHSVCRTESFKSFRKSSKAFSRRRRIFFIILLKDRTRTGQETDKVRVLRRPSRTQTDSMHLKLRLLLNAHEIYIGYTAAGKMLTADFRNGANGDQEHAFASFRKCTKPDSPFRVSVRFRKSVKPKSTLRNFQNVWNMIPNCMGLHDFGNR